LLRTWTLYTLLFFRNVTTLDICIDISVRTILRDGKVPEICRIHRPRSVYHNGDTSSGNLLGQVLTLCITQCTSWVSWLVAIKNDQSQQGMSRTNQIHSRIIYNLDMNTTHLDSRVFRYSQRPVDVLHEKAVVDCIFIT
jgi:hypothetical protein